MDGVDNLADITNASAGCGVHFHHIDVATFHDGHTMFACPARFCCWFAGPVRPNAVHAFSNDPGRRGFTRAPDARHDERLRDAISLKRVLERTHHGVLANKINKRLWSVFAGEDLIGGSVRHKRAFGILCIGSNYG